MTEYQGLAILASSIWRGTWQYFLSGRRSCLRAHKLQRWQVLSNTIYQDLCDQHSCYIWCNRNVLFLCHIFTQRPMNDRKIERRDGRCFGRQLFLADSIQQNFISHEKKSYSSRPEIYKALKPCWLLIRVSIARVVACFPQLASEPAATATDSETPCVCARPSDPRK